MLKDLMNKSNEITNSKIKEVELSEIEEAEREIFSYIGDNYIPIERNIYGNKLLQTVKNRSEDYLGKFTKDFYHTEYNIKLFYSKTCIFFGNLTAMVDIDELYRIGMYQVLADLLGYNNIHTNIYFSEYNKIEKGVMNKVTNVLKRLNVEDILRNRGDFFKLPKELRLKPDKTKLTMMTELKVSEIEKEIRRQSIKAIDLHLSILPLTVSIFDYLIEVTREDIEKDYYYETYLKLIESLKGDSKLTNEGINRKKNREVELQTEERNLKDSFIDIVEVDTSWVTYLEDWINSYKDTTIYDYQKPNKKLVWTGVTMPSANKSRKIDRLSNINLYIDTSSSVDMDKLRKAFSNLHYLFENIDNNINSYVFNTSVKEIKYNDISKDKDRIQLPIGGGTDIDRTLEHIQKYSDMFSVNIIITDGKIDWEELEREMDGRRVAVLVTGKKPTINVKLNKDIKVFKV